MRRILALLARIILFPVHLATGAVQWVARFLSPPAAAADDESAVAAQAAQQAVAPAAACRRTAGRPRGPAAPAPCLVGPGPRRAAGRRARLPPAEGGRQLRGRPSRWMSAASSRACPRCACGTCWRARPPRASAPRTRLPPRRRMNWRHAGPPPGKPSRIGCTRGASMTCWPGCRSQPRPQQSAHRKGRRDCSRRPSSFSVCRPARPCGEPAARRPWT